MNALGWQIGAILFGISSLVIAIYLAKLLDNTTKIIEKANRIVDYNERYINEIIENTAHITKSAESIIDLVGRATGAVKVFRFIKRK